MRIGMPSRGVFWGWVERLRRRAGASETELICAPDFDIWVCPGDRSIGGVIARTRSYETHVTEEIRRSLAPGMTFVDIGANVGWFTLLAARLVGPSGRVIAYEPGAENCELLEASRRANGFENVEIRRRALGSEVGRATLVQQRGTTNAVLFPRPPKELDWAGWRRSVEVVALDRDLAADGRVDVVKMDVEGSEPAVLEGMARVMREQRPTVFAELSPRALALVAGIEPRELLDRIVACGYEIGALAHDAPDPASLGSVEEILGRLDEVVAAGRTHLDVVAWPLERGRRAI